jgi:predicted TPR repeat methyltransferase
MTTSATQTTRSLLTRTRDHRTTRKGRLLVALPEPNLSEPQDAEWCVVQVEGKWRRVRFHDYAELFSIPGLYEKVIYEILGCDSPRVVCDLLKVELDRQQREGDSLRVIDLGAGNGMVGEELARLGTKHIVGVDIIESAARATERDRPGTYVDYHIADMTQLASDQAQAIRAHRFNALTCVAALGFGDIPTAAFTTAYNLVAPGGLVAFNIKEEFLNGQDTSGFAGLIHAMTTGGVLEVAQRKRYQHRLATNRDPLHYVAFVGRKLGDIDVG